MREYERGFSDCVDLVRHLVERHLRGGHKDTAALARDLGRIEEAVKESKIATLYDELGLD
ncbi:MAG: hypothetical protein ACYDDF_05240 [Thermoplasmatota archaeon]